MLHIKSKKGGIKLSRFLHEKNAIVIGERDGFKDLP